MLLLVAAFAPPLVPLPMQLADAYQDRPDQDEFEVVVVEVCFLGRRWLLG